MADEALRMEAEVRDKFTGPLKALRAQLLDTTRAGANHSDTLAKGLGKVEGAMQATARTASSVVNPAFAALGVTGLSVGVAVAGISNALNKLTGNLTGLGQLSRETGVAAKTLQEFGAVAGRFGVEQDAVASGAKNFAAQMRLFSRSTGEAFQWVLRQGTDAAGRKAFQDFATDLQHTSDEGEKLKKALAFMETIKNPVERGIFAQQFFGNADLGRIADGHLGKVVDLFKKAREKLGEYDPADIINAEKFDRSLGSLRSSMQRFGLTVAREVLGPATEFTTWMDDLVSGKRADLTKTLRDGLRDVKKELGEINWKQAGDDAASFLKDSTALAGTLAKAFHEIAETIHNLREGNVAQALRGADGASGPLARKLAPRVGDDEIEAQENVDRLRKLKDIATEASGHFIGRTQQRMGLLASPEQAGKDLDAAEARLKALQGRTPEQRKQEFEASEKLRKSVDALTDEMKASRGGATVQKQSMDTQGGLFGGASIQSAAFGGGGFRRPGGFGGGSGLPGGGSGPGYGGEQGPAGGGAGRSLGGGGRFNPLGGGAVGSPAGPRAETPTGELPEGYTGNDGRRAARGRMSAAGAGNVASWMEFLQKPAADGGLGMPQGKAQATIAMMQGESGLNLNPGSVGDSGHAHGTAQWSDQRGNPRFPLLRRFAESQGKDWRDRGVQQQYLRMEMLGLPGAVSHNRAYRAMMAAPTDEQTLYEGISKFENPQKHALAYQIRKPFLDRLRRGGPAVAAAQRADGTVAAPARPDRADGSGWAAREAARKTFEAQQAEAGGLRASGARVASAASRAGVVSMPALEANGSVVVNVHKPGPETAVRTTASGKLFQDVVQRSGAQMRRAD